MRRLLAVLLLLTFLATPLYAIIQGEGGVSIGVNDYGITLLEYKGVPQLEKAFYILYVDGKSLAQGINASIVDPTHIEGSYNDVSTSRGIASYSIDDVKLTVTQEVRVRKNTNTIEILYTIKNDGASTVNNIQLGFYADVDAGGTAAYDQAFYDEYTKAVIIRDANTNTYIGIAWYTIPYSIELSPSPEEILAKALSPMGRLEKTYPKGSVEGDVALLALWNIKSLEAGGVSKIVLQIAFSDSMSVLKESLLKTTPQPVSGNARIASYGLAGITAFFIAVSAIAFASREKT